jgi:uncharacterized protein (DUF433 family)
MADPISIRLPQTTLDGLKAIAERERLPVRTLVQRMVDEGLRMAKHPMITFYDGPAGRRARAIGAPGDVWEVVSALRGQGVTPESLAAELGCSLSAIQESLGYYAEHREEIDSWVAANDRAYAEGKAAWVNAQAALDD